MVWDALYRYFPGIRSRVNFSADKINDTCNVITLADTLHDAFAEFQLAFESTVRIVSKVLGCSFFMFLGRRERLPCKALRRVPNLI